MDANHHRETVRPRPDVGQKAESNRTQSLRRIASFPHRSLLGQGYSPKPHGAAVWEWHFRAVVEPELCGSRANHRRGNFGSGTTSGVLRDHWRDTRHDPEPRPAADFAG